MIKEYLRRQIVPFIYDDKHRGTYNCDIQELETNPDLLMAETARAQDRLRNQMDTCRLLEYCCPEEGRGTRKGIAGCGKNKKPYNFSYRGQRVSSRFLGEITLLQGR